MATVGSFGIDLGLNTARFEEGLKRAGGGASTFERRFKSVMSGLATASTVAVAGFAALGTAVTAAIDKADGIGDMAAAAGIGTDAFQAWAQAAELAGVSNESFASGLGRTTRLIGDAARGIGPGVKALADLGIAARDAQGNVKSTEQVIGELADKIAAMKSPAEQASAASALLGRDLGPKFAGFLAQGSTGIQEYTNQLRSMGGIISSDVINQADEAEKRMKALSNVVTAQLTSALVSLTPVITSVAQAFANAAPHVAQFFNILRGGNLDAVAGQIGAVNTELTRLRSAQSLANAETEKNMFGRLIADAEKRLATLKAEYAQLMRRPDTALSPAATVDGGDAAAPAAAAASAAVQSTAEDTGKKAGKKAGQAYARELSMQIESTMKSVADLDKLAVMREAATAATQEWADQSERAATRITDSIDRIIFAGFRDGIDGVKESFKSMLVELGLEIARSKIKELLLDAFGSAGSSGGSGNWSSVILNAAATIFGGSSPKSTGSGGLKKFAAGGSFTVPGPPTGDRVVPIFRANGGETITVTPKGKGGNGVTVVQNINAPGANQETVAMIRREAAMAARAAVGEIINMRSRGRL